MQAASLGLQVGGALVKGIGGLKAGNYQAKADLANATNSERDGAAQALEIRHAARQAMGEQVGAQAESGFMPGTGTALQSLRESAINSELDVLDIRRKAASQAAAYRAQAHIAKQEGRNALIGGLFGAATSIANYKSNYAQAGAAAGYGGGGGGGGGGVSKSSGSSGSGAAKAG